MAMHPNMGGIKALPEDPVINLVPADYKLEAEETPAFDELVDSLGGLNLFKVNTDEFNFDHRLLNLQEEYAYNPNAWVEDVIGSAWDPDPWQSLALDELIWDHFVALSTGTGPGKTAFCSVALLYFLANRPFPKVLCTAPTQPQLKRALWPEIAKWMRHSNGLERTFEWTNTRVAMRGQHSAEWFAEAKTARPQPGQSSVEALQGLHADNILVIVDEASGVADQIMNAIDGCITTKGTHVVLAGNPVRRRGYFYRTISDERQRVENGGTWHVHFVSAADSKHVDITALQRNINLYGKQSDYYRVKVLGLPPLADTQGLISPEEVYSMHARDPKGLDKGISVLSCDPARYGPDYSVFYVRKGWTIVDRAEVYGMDGPAVANVGLALYEKHQTDYVCIDSIGIGASVYDHMKIGLRQYKKRVKLEEVIVGEKAFNDEKFFNLRAEILWMLSMLYVPKISIPIETDRLDEELPQFTYGWNQTDTKIKLASKDELRKLLGRSPNDGDSFALCFFPDVRKDAKKLAAASVEYFFVGARSKAALVKGKDDRVGDKKAGQEDHRHTISSVVAGFSGPPSEADPNDPETVIENLFTRYVQRGRSGASVDSGSGRNEARFSGINPPQFTVRRRLGGAFQQRFTD